MSVSPSELLVNRKLRTRLPIVKSQLKPKVENVNDKFVARQNDQKRFYDRSAHERDCFQSGEKVVYRKNNVWESAVITRVKSTPRSYTLLNEKGSYFNRNSSQLKKSVIDPKDYKLKTDNNQGNSFKSNMRPVIVTSRPEENLAPDENVKITRSGRISRPPTRYSA